MRDLLSDAEAGRFLSDPDPVRRAQIQMRNPLPKRFYKAASVEKRDEGFAVLLDKKPVRTPGKSLLALPSEAAARLVAGEFEAQVEEIDPHAMPVLRLANSAIDGVAPNLDAVRDDIASFCGTDLVCYRAGSPESLAERQAELWAPYLDWARARLGARFVLAEGVMHVAQPPEALAAVSAHLAGLADAFRLAALHVVTTLTGSALMAMTLEDGAAGADAVWTAAHLDEDFNIEQWGEDAEAAARRAARRRDFDGAVVLLEALPD